MADVACVEHIRSDDGICDRMSLFSRLALASATKEEIETSAL